MNGSPTAVPSCCGAESASQPAAAPAWSGTDAGGPARIGVLLCACGADMRKL